MLLHLGKAGWITIKPNYDYACTGEKTHVLFLFWLIGRGRGHECGFQQQLPGISLLRRGKNLFGRALLNHLATTTISWWLSALTTAESMAAMNR